MTAFAAINSIGSAGDHRIQIRFYLVVDQVLGITPNDVQSRVRATFGTAALSAAQLTAPHFPWPPSLRHGRIYVSTDVAVWYGVRQSVRRGETFLTDDSYYQRRVTRCSEEQVVGGRSDVITFFASSALPNPLSKLEHELGHALGIRHTLSADSPMYERGGSSQGSSLTVSDVQDILWQIDPDPNRQSRPQILSSHAISALHPRGTITPASPRV